MDKKHSVQDQFLNVLRKERLQISVFLKNGIKLQGTIDGFDQHIVTLKNVTTQIIYKHAISTILPTRQVRLPTAGTPEGEDAPP